MEAFSEPRVILQFMLRSSTSERTYYVFYECLFITYSTLAKIIGCKGVDFPLESSPHIFTRYGDVWRRLEHKQRIYASGGKRKNIVNNCCVYVCICVCV